MAAYNRDENSEPTVPEPEEYADKQLLKDFEARFHAFSQAVVSIWDSMASFDFGELLEPGRTEYTVQLGTQTAVRVGDETLPLTPSWPTYGKLTGPIGSGVVVSYRDKQFLLTAKHNLLLGDSTEAEKLSNKIVTLSQPLPTLKVSDLRQITLPSNYIVQVDTSTLPIGLYEERDTVKDRGDWIVLPLKEPIQHAAPIDEIDEDSFKEYARNPIWAIGHTSGVLEYQIVGAPNFKRPIGNGFKARVPVCTGNSGGPGVVWDGNNLITVGVLSYGNPDWVNKDGIAVANCLCETDNPGEHFVSVNTVVAALKSHVLVPTGRALRTAAAL